MSIIYRYFRLLIYDEWQRSSRRGRLERWLQDELPLRFEGRIQSVDTKVAETWGKTVSRSESAGRPIGAMDASLAATAEIYRLTLVTRHVSDFSLLKAILNPWTETSIQRQI